MDSKPKTITLKDDPTNWKLVLYFVLGTLVYYVLSAPIVLTVNYFKDWNSKSVIFDEIYYRYYVHT